MASGIPNLGLNDFGIDNQASGGELDPDGGLGLKAKFVPSEPGEQVGLAHTRVTDENHLKEIVIVILGFVPSHCSTASLFGSASGEAERETRVRNSFYIIF